MRTLRRILPNIILFFVFVNMIAQPAAAISGFSDIEEGEWYYKYICNLIEYKIINGFPDNTFRPEDTLNADQFIKMIVTAMGNYLENGTKYWASTYIECAEAQGLLDGCDIKDYKNPLIRGEIVCITANALGVKSENAEDYICGLYDLYGYTPEKYIIPVLKVYNEGIITGYPDNTFRYDKYITRAEACVIIDKLVTPIASREHKVTSFTPVPVWYSYNNQDMEKYINEYEGNVNCHIEGGLLSSKNIKLRTKFNPLINRQVIDVLKLFIDEQSYIRLKFKEYLNKNQIKIEYFTDKKFSESGNYSLFNLMFYDAPTNYPEEEWGYDSMFMKLEINKLCKENLIDPVTGRPDVNYEYKIRGLMRTLFGTGKGDVFSDFILDKYIEYAGYKAGELPCKTELLYLQGTQVVFFNEGNGRQLNFTFSED